MSLELALLLAFIGFLIGLSKTSIGGIGMINAALAGGVPEVWLNEEFIKQPLNLQTPPRWLPDAEADRDHAGNYARYAAELFKFSPKPAAQGVTQ